MCRCQPVPYSGASLALTNWAITRPPVASAIPRSRYSKNERSPSPNQGVSPGLTCENVLTTGLPSMREARPSKEAAAWHWIPARPVKKQASSPGSPPRRDRCPAATRPALAIAWNAKMRRATVFPEASRREYKYPRPGTRHDLLEAGRLIPPTTPDAGGPVRRCSGAGHTAPSAARSHAGPERYRPQPARRSRHSRTSPPLP
jgi:hypothetical protein